MRWAAVAVGLTAWVGAVSFLVWPHEEGWWFYAGTGLWIGIWTLHFAAFSGIDIEGDLVRVAGSFEQQTIPLRDVTSTRADRFGITVEYRGGSIESGVATKLPIWWWKTRADRICDEIMRRAREARSK